MFEVDTIPVTPQFARGFSGSYAHGDVTFLLTPVPVRTMSVEEKERHIQLRGGHYSSVLSPERAPERAYLELFESQTAELAPRVAADVYALAQAIEARHESGPITVVSLARAGTPVGVLVHRTLALLGRDSTHYCVSIFRDKGLDANALAYILEKHAAKSVVFVDGWTGKGVVGRTLAASVAEYNREHGCAVNPDLYVLSDIAGTAAVAASRDDYLLPSAILNGTVSGLVSRTVLNEYVGPKDFHGCALLHHLAFADRSQMFVDTIWSAVQAVHAGNAAQPVRGPAVNAKALAMAVQRYLKGHGLTDINLVKPGVGEATRVLLRRAPRLLAVRDVTDPYVKHLLWLAERVQAPVTEDPTLPCRALAVIATPD